MKAREPDARTTRTRAEIGLGESRMHRPAIDPAIRYRSTTRVESFNGRGELAVPLTESVDATVAGRHFGRFPAGAIIGASALSDSRLPQLEAIAGESCRVLRIPIAAVKQRAKRDSQLARTIDRVAREDLARKLERMVFMAAGVAPKSGGELAQKPKSH